MRSRFTKELVLSTTAHEAFAFHERDDAFKLLTPPGFGIEVQSTATTLEPSDEVVRFIAKLLFLRFRFGMRHTVYEPPTLFADEQVEGLFSSWRHEHRFREAGWQGDPATLLSDTIELSHPLLPFFLPFVRHRLRSLFRHRHQVTWEQLQDRCRGGDLEGRRVVVTGGTGLIGGRVIRILVEKGARVIALVRDPERAAKKLGDNKLSDNKLSDNKLSDNKLSDRVEIKRWDFTQPDQSDWRRHVDGADAVIHLAGTPLFQQRWSAQFKQRMAASRIDSTRQLVEAMAMADRPPSCFVSASALGIYGTDHTLLANEQTPPADDLLARICIDWEGEAVKAQELGVRTAVLRIGIVLSRHSGAVKEMLPPFLLGLGGVMGEPQPYFNWIHLEDVARIAVMAVSNQEMSGPYNLAAPTPVRNQEFAHTLAQVLKRPCLLHYPTAVMKLIIGEAGEYSSGGAQASCDRVLKHGYRFFFDTLEPALANVLHG